MILNDSWTYFQQKGWRFLDDDGEFRPWINAAKRNIVSKFKNKQYDMGQLRSGSTWFVGINFLDNGPKGDIKGVPFSSKIQSDIRRQFGSLIECWDQGQVSICWPGYPRRDLTETLNSFKYRVKKYASHVDGLIPTGNKRRRFAREFHAFILGIPIINSTSHSAPIIVWEGSHLIFRDLFKTLYSGLSEFEVNNLDITEIYQECRRKVFSTCSASIVCCDKNRPYILDRHRLHGVLPWVDATRNLSVTSDTPRSEIDPLAGRAVIYFRPQYEHKLDWVFEN